MKYIIDIDGTICTNTNGQYDTAQPIESRILHFNQLYQQGHQIHYWTARGSQSGLDWTEVTHQQLKLWGVLYHELKLGKPSYDHWIDDKAQNVEIYFQTHTADRS